MSDVGGRRVIASISGGKDSAAMSLHLRELGLEHDRVFMDTGWEHPLTYEYLRGELTRVIGPVTEIRGPRQMVDLVLKRGMFPSKRRRFCTQELKVFPMRDHLAALVFQAPLGDTGETWPIDKVVQWSRTSRGGRQLEIFAADPADAGCMRWGLCETEKP